MNDFKKSLNVPKNKLNKMVEIINNLEKLETEYNPYLTEKRELNRTNILRSGSNVFLNIMLVSELLYSLHAPSKKGIIDAQIIGRVKSMESIEKKQNREGRENKENGDIIAYNIIMERIHNSKDFAFVYDDINIQGLYTERKRNLAIMKNAIDFIESFTQYDISSDLDDESSLEDDKKKLETMKQECQPIKKNIDIYNKEEKINFKAISKEESLIRMCEDLINKAKAIEEKKLKGLEPVAESLNMDKGFMYKLYNLLKGCIDSEDLEEIAEVLKIDKEFMYKLYNLLNGYIDAVYLQETAKVLKIDKKVVDKLNNLLNRDIDSEGLEELAKLLKIDEWFINQLYEIIEITRIKLYTSILEHLQKREDEITDNKEENSNNERNYGEFLILILYQLSKLAFYNEKKYRGLSYNSLWDNLDNQLREYKNSEIDLGAYRNVTFESLQKLITNLRRLHSSLSDKLQYAIALDEMQHKLKSIIEKYMNTSVPNVDMKIKTNDYVAMHYDFKNVEIKMTTHYRNRVATAGTASYANGRIDNAKEKMQNIDRLDLDTWLKKQCGGKRRYKGKKSPIIENEKSKYEISKENEKKLERENKEDLIAWRTDILKITPRYFNARYNKEKKVVEIEFLSALENVKKYYSQTSVRSTRIEVENKIDKIKQLKLLSDTSYTIEIPYEFCKEFCKCDMVQLRTMINNQLSNVGKKIEKMEVSKFEK